MTNNFKRIVGDKARRYQDTITGEILSRRAYDQRFGRFKETGLTPERLAEKERKENPIQAALRPRKGKRSAGDKAIRKQIKKNRRKAKFKTDVFIGEFQTGFSLQDVINAIYELLRIGTRTIYYTTLITRDNLGNINYISNGFYKRVPTTPQEMTEQFNEILEFESGYQLDIIGIIWHWRIKK